MATGQSGGPRGGRALVLPAAGWTETLGAWTGATDPGVSRGQADNQGHKTRRVKLGQLAKGVGGLKVGVKWSLRFHGALGALTAREGGCEGG